MAVKQKNRKANNKKTLLNRAVKIRCCYCEANETCVYRVRKEKSENANCMTYCTLTPNVLKKHKKKNSKKR